MKKMQMDETDSGGSQQTIAKILAEQAVGDETCRRMQNGRLIGRRMIQLSIGRNGQQAYDVSHGETGEILNIC